MAASHLISFFPLVFLSPVRFCSDLGTQDRWDHNTTKDSREQWERLVWEWESLTLMERYVCFSLFPAADNTSA